MRLSPMVQHPFNDVHENIKEFDGLAELFHENTKTVTLRLYPRHLTEGTAGENSMQATDAEIRVMQRAFKVYEKAPRVKLPSLSSLLKLEASFQETVQLRRTVHNFTPIDPKLQDISYLLNLSYGITGGFINQRLKSVQFMRAAPSGGALYPLELYVVPLRKLTELQDGLYHFNVNENALEQLKSENLFQPLYDVLMAGQPANLRHILGEGSLAVIITAVFQRNMGKYGNRGYRYIMLEAGHVMQNLVLSAVACGYSAFQSAAFDDDALSDLLDVHGVEEAPLYYSVIGGNVHIPNKNRAEQRG